MIAPLSLPQFELEAKGPISEQCLDFGIGTFREAAGWVRGLPYGRNDRSNPESIFTERKGTCSTKHMWLAQILEEHNLQSGLTIGIFMMNAENTPQLHSFFKERNLEAIPEAHTYLLFGDRRYDFTRPEMSSIFTQPVIVERAMKVKDMDDKRKWHRAYMKKWIDDNPTLPFDMESLWQLREEAILLLSKNK